MGSLHVLEGTMNAERYLKILEQHMLPSTSITDVYYRPVTGIKFEMSSLCAYNFKISQFKHLLCYLCYIVNKILARVI